jgi:hypothetical protein
MTVSPYFLLTPIIASRTAFLSLGFKLANKKLEAILSLICAIYSALFACTGGMYSFSILNFPNTSAETDILGPVYLF